MTHDQASRRTFLQHLTALGLTHSAFGQMSGMQHRHDTQARAQKDTPPAKGAAPAKMLRTVTLPPFVDALPRPTVLRPTMVHGRRELSITMREVSAKVHRDVPTTRLWSYGEGALAPVIEARTGEPMDIHWHNRLPQHHFLPIDYSLHGSGRDVPEVRAIAHMHGAKVRSQDDGYPEDWYPVGKSRTCHYPLDQDATALWFHDHAMGLNRLNAYAGLFGMLLLRDDVEDALQLPAGEYEVPLIFYDRDFTQDGQLFYDISEDPEHPWIPEFSADAILINGKIRPFLEVEPRLYRFRTLNVANSRFFSLSFSTPPTQQLSMLQIGSDQGLLSAPVSLDRLTLAPAERADILVDFSAFAGQRIHLRTGGLDILECRVAGSPRSKDRNKITKAPHTLRPVERIPEASATRTRTITLNEYQDQASRPMVMLLNRKHWHEPTTEHVKLNSTEIWEFVNLTEDTHPMHIHLVRFQILDRRPFDTSDYLLDKKLRYTAEAANPSPNEMGWKDVVQCPAGTVTRIIMRFEGYTGKYLYHCHILEHEANDMMRPFEVVA